MFDTCGRQQRLGRAPIFNGRQLARGYGEVKVVKIFKHNELTCVRYLWVVRYLWATTTIRAFNGRQLGVTEKER